jgi:hypothetical protein
VEKTEEREVTLTGTVLHTRRLRGGFPRARPCSNPLPLLGSPRGARRTKACARTLVRLRGVVLNANNCGCRPNARHRRHCSVRVPRRLRRADAGARRALARARAVQQISARARLSLRLWACRSRPVYERGRHGAPRRARDRCSRRRSRRAQPCLRACLCVAVRLVRAVRAHNVQQPLLPLHVARNSTFADRGAAALCALPSCRPCWRPMPLMGEGGPADPALHRACPHPPQPFCPSVRCHHSDSCLGTLLQVYMYAGVAKLNSDWLLHAEPMASKLAGESLRHDVTLRGLLCRHEVAVAVCSRVAGVGARVRPGRRAASGHRSLGGRSPLRSAGRVCHRPATVDLADLPLPLIPTLTRFRCAA